jgi:hypothetical protein
VSGDSGSFSDIEWMHAARLADDASSGASGDDATIKATDSKAA